MIRPVQAGIGRFVTGISAVIALLSFDSGQKLQAADPVPSDVVTVYKNPQCGCCGQWVSHLRAQGFEVVVHDVADTTKQRAQWGVPAALGSCHTATVNRYVIEGHVPAADIRQLLRQKPAVVGIAVPGMPAGSPGMESSTPVAYQTRAFTKDGKTFIFAEHPPAPKAGD
jgi:hypothetical protein